MIFKFIFLVFAIGLVVVLSFIMRVIRQVRRGVDEFQKQVNGEDNQPRTRSKTYGNREGVVDQAPSSTKQKKIFPKDEGEYVEYTEEK